MNAYKSKSDPQRRADPANPSYARLQDLPQAEPILPMVERLELHLKTLKKTLCAPPSEAQAVQRREVTAQQVRQILKARRKREAFFGPDLFADPAWDILLEVFAAEAAQQKISVSAACIAAAVPPTTALRWLAKLEQVGLIVRSADNLDRRRHWVQLSPTATAAVERYLAAVVAENLSI